MPGRLRNIVLAGAVALVIAGCGSDDEGTIPESAAQNLIAQLDAVQASVAAGDCENAQARAADLVQLVNELPSDVGVDTKEGLREAATNLAELTTDPSECATGPTGVETPTTTTEETTEPATTETTTTTTDTNTDEDEEEPPDDERPPDDEQPPDDEPPAPPSDQGPGGGQGGGEPPSGGLGPGGDDKR